MRYLIRVVDTASLYYL